MKNSMVAGALAFLALVFTADGMSVDRAENIKRSIEQASGALLDGTAPEDQMWGALIRLLDTAIQALPDTGFPADARSNLEAARAELKSRSQLSPEGHQRLALAYRALNGGKEFQFPDIHTIEEAKARIKGLAASSVASLNKGEPGLTSRLLLECVIMVVTPMTR